MKVGRNDPCPCGSGKKYKHCCYAKDSVKQEADPEVEVESAEAQSDEAEEAQTPDDESTEDHHHTPHRHNSGRARFQGDKKAGSASFRPRVSRGGQRGS